MAKAGINHDHDAFLAEPGTLVHILTPVFD
jgi:hypothetical protein